MEDNLKRYGDTIVTSVSVSKEFQKLVSQYNLSPTECFRRGVATTLFDLGVDEYKTEKNEERFNYVKEFMERIEKDEVLKEKFEKIKLFEKININFNKIKKIIEELE